MAYEVGDVIVEYNEEFPDTILDVYEIIEVLENCYLWIGIGVTFPESVVKVLVDNNLLFKKIGSK